MAARPRVWAAPLLLAALGIVGLISALLADGVWDVLSWFCLGTPLVVVTWYVWGASASN